MYSLSPPHDLSSLSSYCFLDIIRVDVVEPKILPATTQDDLKSNTVSGLKHQLKSFQCTYSVGFLFTSTYFVFLASGSLFDFPLSFFRFGAAGCRAFEAEGFFKFKPVSLGTLKGADLCFCFFSVSTWLDVTLFLETLFEAFSFAFFRKTPFCFCVARFFFSG